MTEEAKKLGNQPASPCLDNNDYAGQIKVCSEGLTKREYFAGLAMQELIAAYAVNVVEDSVRIANEAVFYADALLEELAK